MSTKIALSFNKRAYTKAEQAHTEYKSAKAQLIALIDSYGVEGKSLIKSPQIYKDSAEAIYTLLSEGSTLPKGINKLKFLELMDVDLMPLSKGVNSYNALLKFADKPKKETYTTYLDGANKDAYDDLIELVNVLNKLDKKGYIKNKVGIQNALANRISVDYITTEFKFNS